MSDLRETIKDRFPDSMYPNLNFLNSVEVCWNLRINFSHLIDLIENNEILAVRFKGDWYFPLFQFTDLGDWMIDNLKSLLDSFPSNMYNDAKIGWLIRPNCEFNGISPIEVFKAGDQDSVICEVNTLGIL